MNQLFWSLIPLVAQVSILSFVLIGIYYFGIRRNASATVNLLTAGFVLMVGLCIAAVTPLPSWFQSTGGVNVDFSKQDLLGNTDGADRIKNAIESDQRFTGSFGGNWTGKLSPPNSDVKSKGAFAGTAFESAKKVPEFGEFAKNWGWFGIAVGLIFALAGIGILRVILGVIALGRLKHGLKPVDSKPISEMLDVLCAKAHYNQPISVWRSPFIATAATIGYRKPMILLSENSVGWTSEQMNSVLAHEVAHVHHHDFLKILVSQLCMSAHFYNPLVFCLLGKLRISQEIAADNLAANLTGDRDAYTRVLAEMALNQDTQPPLAFAPMFLPSDQTFIRRIQMLRQQTDRRFGLSTGMLAAITIVATVAIAGLRMPASNPPSKIKLPVSVIEVAHADDLASLDYVGPTSNLVSIVRPAKFMKHWLVKRLMRKNVPVQSIVDQQQKSVKRLTGLELDEIDQITTCQLFDRENYENSHQYLVVKTVRDNMKNFESLDGTIEEEGGNLRITLKSGSPRFGLVVDAKTSIWSQDEGSLEVAQITAHDNVENADWYEIIKSELDQPALMVLGDDAPLEILTGLTSQPEIRETLTDEQVENFKNAESVLLSMDFEKNIALHGRIGFADNSQVKVGHETATAVLNYAKQVLPQLERAIPDEQKALLKIAKQAIDNIQLKAGDEILSANSNFEINLRSMDSLFGGTADAMHRTDSANRIRQLAIAMHNYHDAHGTFPSSAIRHESGKTHSWRIAILPYLEESELYDNYRFNEDWNSEHNLRVTATMPDIFRHPTQTEGNSSSYYAVVGAETCFNDDDGTTLMAISEADGASRTGLFVEAKRSFHWSKPEDIPLAEVIDTKIGGYSNGGFNTAMCDGSVHFVPDTLEDRVLKALFTMNGGEDPKMFEF